MQFTLMASELYKYFDEISEISKHLKSKNTPVTITTVTTELQINHDLTKKQCRLIIIEACKNAKHRNK